MNIQRLSGRRWQSPFLACTDSTKKIPRNVVVVEKTQQCRRVPHLKPLKTLLLRKLRNTIYLLVVVCVTRWRPERRVVTPQTISSSTLASAGSVECNAQFALGQHWRRRDGFSRATTAREGNTATVRVMWVTLFSWRNETKWSLCY